MEPIEHYILMKMIKTEEEKSNEMKIKKNKQKANHHRRRKEKNIHSRWSSDLEMPNFRHTVVLWLKDHYS